MFTLDGPFSIIKYYTAIGCDFFLLNTIIKRSKQRNSKTHTHFETLTQRVRGSLNNLNLISRQQYSLYQLRFSLIVFIYTKKKLHYEKYFSTHSHLIFDCLSFPKTQIANVAVNAKNNTIQLFLVLSTQRLVQSCNRYKKSVTFLVQMLNATVNQPEISVKPDATAPSTASLIKF